MSTTKNENPINEPEIKTTVKIKAPAQPQRLIYCGPNIPGGALQKFAVFKGGTPGHLVGLIEKCPAIKELIVPVPDLGKTEQAIATQGSRFNALYNDVVAFSRKGGV